MSVIEQLETIRSEDNVNDDLNRLSRKYSYYQTESIRPNGSTNEYIKIIKIKDIQLDDLKKENEFLKQKLIDLTIVYNTKIDNIKIEHEHELRRMHAQYITRI